MSDNDTDAVRRALDQNLTNHETLTVNEPSGVVATVPEAEIGRFWRTARQMDFDVNATRAGDALIAHIGAEQSGGLGDLFR